MFSNTAYCRSSPLQHDRHAAGGSDGDADSNVDVGCDPGEDNETVDAAAAGDVAVHGGGHDDDGDECYCKDLRCNTITGANIIVIVVVIRVTIIRLITLTNSV